MKTFLLAALALASIASTSPVAEEKRYMVTDIVLETATVTVTGKGDWGPWKSQTTTNNPMITTTSSSAASTSQSSTGPGSDYSDPILKQHNLHRANHSAPDLVWDVELAGFALEIAQTCWYDHSSAAGDGNYGQNIGAGSVPEEVPKMITNLMYNNELEYYPGQDHSYGGEPDGNLEKWGHFTAIVWKNTTSVGCATYHCENGLGNSPGTSPYFTVCNYRPSGNVGGLYSEMVQPPRGDPMIEL